MVLRHPETIKTRMGSPAFRKLEFSRLQAGLKAIFSGDSDGGSETFDDGGA